MHPDYQETAFVTNKGIYCYKVLPSSLKNASATYQILVNHMFKEQLEDTIEVYIDDMLVKSKKADEHIQHLTQALEDLRQYGMKLNPKCTFRVSASNFIGYIMTQRGIKASLDQITTLVNIQSRPLETSRRYKI